MVDKIQTYEELEQQLREAKQLIDALRGGEIDAVINKLDVTMLRARMLEEKLKQSEENFRNSMDDSPLGIRIDTEDGYVLYANKALLEIYGYSSLEELNTVPAKLRMTPQSYEDHRKRIVLRKQGKTVLSSYEIDIIRKDGEIRHLSASRKEVKWNGKTQLQIVFQDISESRHAAELLRLNEQKYRELTESISDVFFALDGDLRYTHWNKASEKLAGISAEDAIGKTLHEIYPPNEARTQVERMFMLAIETKQPQHFTVNYPGGGGLAHEINAYPTTEGVSVFVRDVSERKRNEETLRLQSELLDLESDSVFLHDFNGNLIYFNRAFNVTHGYTKEELLNMKLYQLDDPESAKASTARINEVLEKGNLIFNVSHRHKNGSWIPLEIHDSLIELGGKQLIMSVARDITERQKLLEQLMAQDRLASIGQLVSGVAHEINNPLTSIIGFSDLILEKDLPEEVKADLKVVNDEAHRTAKIVQNLLGFTRKQSEERAQINLNEQIQKVLSLREHEQKINDIQVITHFAPELPELIGNASKLLQIFLNLIVNAEQAMLEGHNKGTITITTERKGDIIVASIADEGPGISPENMSRLFTPFFTTKGVGKGTGLGLSICHGIVAEHGGRIYAESEPGKGATFIIEFPVAKGTL